VDDTRTVPEPSRQPDTPSQAMAAPGGTLDTQHDRSPTGARLTNEADAAATAKHGTRPAFPSRPPAVPGYEILDEVGRGGMGVVYRARQLRLGRVVALKMILAGGHAGREDLERFQTEAEAVARLQHPGIVQIHEVGEHEGLPYFSLEFVPAGSLASKLRGDPWPAERAADVIEQLARAVHHAHQAGILHRDLKPANVLLAADGTPKITDFGLAKKLDGTTVATQTGAVMGTPSYMAPEQAHGRSRDVGPAVDVYALGAVLYELLTGRPPFKGTTALETLAQVVSCEPVPPAHLAGKVSRDLETICLKCLRKEAARRYASAGDLADDLRRFRAGEPIRARPVGSAERALKWVKRHPGVAGLLAGLVVVIVASLIALTGLWMRAERQRADADYQKGQATQAAEQARTAEGVAEKKAAEARTARDLADQRRAGERLHRYIAHTSLAQMAWGGRNMRRLRQLLDREVPADGETDLRAFEWHYLLRLLEGSRVTLTGHTDTVTAIDFSPEGRRLASASLDRTVKIWELPTGLEIRTLKGHADGVVGVVFSPDGQRVVSCGQDGAIKMWDASTGQELFALADQTPAKGGLAFGPDGKSLAVAGNRTVTICDPATGKETFTFRGHTAPVTAVAFSADSKQVASAAEGDGVRVWEAAGGKELAHFPMNKGRLKRLSYRGEGVLLLEFSHGGMVLLAIKEREQRPVFDGYERDSGWPSALSPDGRLITQLAPAETVRVWERLGNQEAFALRGHTAPVTDIAFSARGDRIATASKDKTIRAWTALFNQEHLTYPGHTLEVNAVAYSPDGRTLATAAGDGTLRLREADTGQEVRILGGHPGRIRLQGRRPDGTVYFLGGVTAAAYSRDGRRLASGGADGTIRVRDPESGRELFAIAPAHRSAVTGVAFSPNGKLLASSSWDRTVCIWNAETGRKLHTLPGHQREVMSVAFSPKGDILASGSWDRTVRLWDPETGAEVRRLTGQVRQYDSVAFSPDGKLLAASSNPFDVSGEVTVFDTATGNEKMTLKGHIYGVYQVAFSPRGDRIATVGCEGAAKVWETQTGEELLTFQPTSEKLHCLAWDPDGRRIALGSRHSMVYVLDSTLPDERLLLQREAYFVACLLYEKHKNNKAAVLEQIRTATEISEPLRKETRARAERFLRAPE
jgi:WD40 repeat protein